MLFGTERGMSWIIMLTTLIMQTMYQVRTTHRISQATRARTAHRTSQATRARTAHRIIHRTSHLTAIINIWNFTDSSDNTVII